MRKFYFVLLFCAITGVSFAQLKVANTGKVGINIGTNTPVSNLSVNSVGNSNSALFVTGATNGIWAERSGTPGGSWVHSVVGNAPVASGRYNVGLKGQSYLISPLGSGRSWGVMGIGGNSTTGYNYGVFGTTYGSQNGAGIVGTINNNQDVNIPGIYAGYFVGDIRVTETMYAQTVVEYSDMRLKQNIAELKTAIPASKGVSTLNTVLQMTPVEYNLKQQYLESTGDSATVKQVLYDEKSQLFKKKHYGLIAQDLQELYPDLVYEGDDGYLSINYTGIIPLLIQSIKELKAELDGLKSSNSPVKKSAQAATSLSPDGTGTAALYQNTPNPFTQSTRIQYYLPSTITKAYLCIYDLQGRQLKQISIAERGEGVQVIPASDFRAGIYLYGLIADGSQVDMKRMILTE
ncbi:MAG: tail fiber domain-containing protein [Mariniphaga sp.]